MARAHRSRTALARVLALALGASLALGLGVSARAAPETLRHSDAGELWLRIDTHVHSRFSDGAESLVTICRRAEAEGLDVLAFTDHAGPRMRGRWETASSSIAAARRACPRLVILAGMEWNLPPYGGRVHATVLMPPGPEEGRRLAKLAERFDDAERRAPPLSRALAWLDATAGAGPRPVVLVNHPARRAASLAAAEAVLLEAFAAGVVGASGAPGHQGGRPPGVYPPPIGTDGRWDPTLRPGGAWDRALRDGLAVTMARAPSDFHNDDPADLADRWPGTWSATWVRARARTAEAVLDGLRAGATGAGLGGVGLRPRLRLRVGGTELGAGATAELDVGQPLELRLEADAADPALAWTLILTGRAGTEVRPVRPDAWIALELPPGGLALRGAADHPDGRGLRTGAIRLRTRGGPGGESGSGPR